VPAGLPPGVGRSSSASIIIFLRHRPCRVQHSSSFFLCLRAICPADQNIGRGRQQIYVMFYVIPPIQPTAAKGHVEKLLQAVGLTRWQSHSPRIRLLHSSATCRHVLRRPTPVTLDVDIPSLSLSSRLGYPAGTGELSSWFSTARYEQGFMIEEEALSRQYIP